MMFDEGIKRLPVTPDNVSGIEFLRFYTSQNPPAWGGSPGQDIPRKVLEDLNRPGTPPPADFFKNIRENLNPSGVKQASLDPFDIDSPETTEAIQRYVEKFGEPPKVTPEQLQKNIERLRGRLGPMVRGA
jgi:hypothetical protein